MAAAALLLTAAGSSWFIGRHGGAATNLSPVSALVPQAIRLDLRSLSLERGGSSTQSEMPVALPRNHVAMTILLPVGAEPGTYEVKLINVGGETLASSRGAAAVVEFITTLNAELDLASMAPGRYQLGIRASEEQWRFLSVALN